MVGPHRRLKICHVLVPGRQKALEPVASHNLLAPPTGQAQQVVVAEGNAAFAVQHHGGQFHVLQQFAETAFALAQFPGSLFALGDVQVHHHAAIQMAIGQRRDRHQEPVGASRRAAGIFDRITEGLAGQYRAYALRYLVFLRCAATVRAATYFEVVQPHRVAWALRHVCVPETSPCLVDGHDETLRIQQVDMRGQSIEDGCQPCGLKRFQQLAVSPIVIEDEGSGNGTGHKVLSYRFVAMPVSSYLPYMCVRLAT